MLNNNGKMAIGRNTLYIICIICLMFTSFGFVVENSFAVDLNETCDEIGVVSDSDNILENSQQNDVMEVNSENSGEILGVERKVNGNTFDDIQTVIDKSESGDKIILSGNYYSTGSQIDIKKPLTITASSTTVLDAKGLSGIFYISSGAQGTTIQNLKMINGKRHVGSAIAINAKNVNIDNCIFEKNRCTEYGGAVKTSQDLYACENLKVSNCQFIGNLAYRDGFESFSSAAALSAYSRNTQITNCYFESNWVKSKEASYGGAIQIGMDLPGSNAIVKDCVFKNNAVYSIDQKSHGGAGCVRDGTSYINCIFINNTADEGGALTFHASGTIKNCTFINNKANSFGGALSTGYLYDFMVLYIDNCNFEGNTAPLGGAIQARGLNVNVLDCNFKNNEVSQYGGAINIIADDVNIKNSIFNFNVAKINGGAVYINGANTLIKNSSFKANEAIPTVKNLNDGLGGAIYIKSSYATINDNEFVYNVARNGSAIYYDRMGEKLSLDNNTFLQNQAWSYQLPIYAKDILYEDTENIRVVLYGGNNIADFDNLAVSNAIFNAAEYNNIVVNGESPVDGATNSGLLYQDGREYNMNILLTVTDEEGRIIYNEMGITNYLGEISIDLENLNPGKYYISAKHYEDNYYKQIFNQTSFTVYPKVDNLIQISTTNSSFNFEDVIVWTINIANEGPNNSTGVTINNVLPDGLVWLRDSTNGKYNPDNGTLYIGDLNVGENLCFTITTVVEKTGNIAFKANITSNDHDINLTNNQDEKIIQVAPAADLTVIKSSSNFTFNYRDYVNWTIVVTNNGPDDAHNVTVCDKIPDSLIFISSNGNYDNESGIWYIGTLENNQKVQLNIKCFVNKTGLIQNNVSVNGSEFDYDFLNNNDSERIFINPASDLSIKNTANNTNLNFGDLVKWTLVIENNGPDEATDIKVEDLLPDGFVYLNSTLNLTDGIINIEKLGVGDKMVIDIITKVNVTGTCLSVANVTSKEHDYDLTNNEDDETVFVNPASDLVIEKSVDEPEPKYGEYVIWTITVCNNGPDDAFDVVVTELLPDSLIWYDDDSLGSYNPINGEWRINRLNNSEIISLNIECIVAATGEIQNNVSVQSTNYDYNLTNNKANETIDVEKSADVSIVKLVNKTNPNYNDLVKWTLIISNNGPDKASNIYVEDLLPEGLILLNFTKTKGFFDGSKWVMCCLEKDETQYLEIICKVNKTGNITNIAMIQSDEYDFNETNNVANQTINVPLAVDLEITIETDHEDVLFGDEVLWMITVKNNGPDNATNVVLHDLLPEGLIVVGHDLTKGEYSDDVWVFDSLNVGESVYLNLTTLSNSLGEKTVEVDVDCDEYDWDKSNNHDDFTINVKPVANLLISKLVDNNSPNYGDFVKWTLIAFNEGPNTATNVKVYDELPKGLQFIRANGNYNKGIWNVGNLDVGQSKELEIICKVQATGKFVNKATIGSDELDPDLNNNYDEQSIHVAPASDLAVTKIASKYKFYVGDVIDYVIEIVNNGPDTAYNIKLQEKLGKSLQLKSFKVTKGKFNKNTNTWSIDSLAYGESALLYIKAIAAGEGILKNIVTVTSDNYDPSADDNKDFAVVNVTKKPDNSINTPMVEKQPLSLDKNHESILERHPTANPFMMLVASAIFSIIFLGGSISKRK